MAAAGVDEAWRGGGRGRRGAESLWEVGGGGWGWGEEGGLVEEDAPLDGLTADGALAHTVAAQLTGAVTAHEDHVLQPVQTHRTHGLFFDVLELLLELLYVCVDVGVVFVSLQGRDVSTGPT